MGSQLPFFMGTEQWRYVNMFWWILQPARGVMRVQWWHLYYFQRQNLISCIFCLSDNRPVNLYVSVNAQTNTLTHLVQCLLANLTGITINTTQENCQNQREDEKDTKNKQVILRTALLSLIDLDLVCSCNLRQIMPQRKEAISDLYYFISL